jgi:hypothetical protein
MMTTLSGQVHKGAGPAVQQRRDDGRFPATAACAPTTILKIAMEAT